MCYKIYQTHNADIVFLAFFVDRKNRNLIFHHCFLLRIYERVFEWHALIVFSPDIPITAKEYVICGAITLTGVAGIRHFNKI